MKKTFLVLMLCFYNILTWGQSNVQFMGVPVNSSWDSFCSAIKPKINGYKTNGGLFSETTFIEGTCTFSNYNNCKFYATRSKDGNFVECINIEIPIDGDDNRIKSAAQQFSDAYARKYNLEARNVHECIDTYVYKNYMMEYKVRNTTIHISGYTRSNTIRIWYSIGTIIQVNESDL